MDKIQVGVVGVGVLGNHHARLYGQCSEAELRGVYDSDQQRAAAVAAEYGTAAYSDIEALISDCDALSVAVPTDRHYDVVSYVLEQGRHVLVEKPIAGNVAEAEKLVALADQRDLIIGVGHVERFNPVLDCLYATPGEARFIEAHRLAPYPPPREDGLPRGTEVSVVHDLMIHDVDIILNLVQSELERVDAVGVPILSPADDIANARLVFRNGCVANMTASRASTERMRKIRVFKPNTYLSLDYQQHCGEIAYVDNHTIRREAVPVRERNALLEELQDFCRAVLDRSSDQSRTDPLVNGYAGLTALRTVEHIEQVIADARTA